MNKKSINTIIILLIIVPIIYIGIIFIADYLLEEGILLGTIVCVSTLLFVVFALIMLKCVINIGYYECKKCHHKFTPKYMDALLAPHFIMSRYLSCPKCNEKSWTKKIIN